MGRGDGIRSRNFLVVNLRRSSRLGTHFIPRGPPGASCRVIALARTSFFVLGIFGWFCLYVRSLVGLSVMLKPVGFGASACAISLMLRALLTGLEGAPGFGLAFSTDSTRRIPKIPSPPLFFLRFNRR